jgi:CRP-like cAMP-binding protein
VVQLDAYVDLLRHVPLFRELDVEYIKVLAFSAERLLYRDGDEIVRAGEPGDAAYVVVSGKAERVDGDSRRVIEPGAMVGETAMLVEVDYAATVTAVEETVVLELSRTMLHRAMRTFPEISDVISTRIEARLLELAEDLRKVEHQLAM